MSGGVCRLNQNTTDGIAESSRVKVGDGRPIATTWSFSLQLNIKLVCLVADSFVARTAHIHDVRRAGVPEAQGCPLPPPGAKLALVEIDVTKSLVLGKSLCSGVSGIREAQGCSSTTGMLPETAQRAIL